MQALPILETDPQKVWDLMEKHYHANYFEQVIYKKYGYIFEDKDQEEFMSEMIRIRNDLKSEVLDIDKQYENEIR